MMRLHQASASPTSANRHWMGASVAPSAESSVGGGEEGRGEQRMKQSS